MYVRRKVFSVVDENDYYEDRYFSEYDDEYDVVDELMEKAFSDGYEYAQREYAESDDKKKDSHALRNSAIVVGSLAGGTGAVIGAKKLGEKIVKDQGLWNRFKDTKVRDNAVMNWAFGKPENTGKVKFGKALQKPYDWAVNAGEWASKKWKGLSGGGKTAVVAVPVAALAGGLALKKRKSDKD